MKRVKGTLSRWSRETYGDIFNQLAIWKDTVNIKKGCLKRFLVKSIEWCFTKKYFHCEEEFGNKKGK